MLWDRREDVVSCLVRPAVLLLLHPEQLLLPRPNQ